MKPPFSLDGRLSLCADYVRENTTVADIGTDHAYLPVWLCKTGKIKKALACDVKKAPLQNGIDTIKKYSAENQVEPRLSDGLAEIKDNEADDIIIAGMGGELIAKIIDNCNWAKNKNKHFILQPMTKGEVLIKYLYENGFEIISQNACIDGDKVYTVMLAAFTEKNSLPDESFLYTGLLNPNESPAHRQFINNQIKLLKNKAKGDKKYFDILKKVCDKYDNS